jgi:hypothetical protein
MRTADYRTIWHARIANMMPVFFDIDTYEFASADPRLRRQDTPVAASGRPFQIILFGEISPLSRRTESTSISLRSVRRQTVAPRTNSPIRSPALYASLQTRADYAAQRRRLTLGKPSTEYFGLRLSRPRPHLRADNPVLTPPQRPIDTSKSAGSW